MNNNEPYIVGIGPGDKGFLYPLATAAIEKAAADTRSRRIDDVPDHLKDAHYSGAAKLGRGMGYRYPHDYGGYVTQQYLPDDLYREGKK